MFLILTFHKSADDLGQYIPIVFCTFCLQNYPMCIIDPQYSQKKKGEITNNDEEENDKID